MKIAMQQICEERLDERLNPLDPLALCIYRLYLCPMATVSRRLVVLTQEQAWWQLDGQRRAVSIWLETDAACQLIWNTMEADGERIGEVVFDCRPEPGDYVFQRRGDGYRIALGLEQDERALARGAA